MRDRSSLPRRRQLLEGLLAGTAAVAAAPLAARAQAPAPASPTAKRNVKLGFDNFSVRAMKWKAPQLIEYAASLRTDSLFISDLDAFESLETKHLAELRKRAADKGLQLHLGTWSICPTSNVFKKTWGTAEQHLALAIRVAKDLGSPVCRVVLGNSLDRASEGGIRARIKDAAKVIKANRGRARDAGVKIAMENHSGDMQAWEVVALIEEAGGKQFVGANMDAGNAAWALEDPLANLEILGPYAVTTSLRDSVLWESDNGITVAWTAMGDGSVDWKAYFDRFAVLCPGVPVHIETISGVNREFSVWNPDFWKTWPEAKGRDFARFVALAKRGKPRPPWKAPGADGPEKLRADEAYQKEQIERSIRYCKDVLGLGLQA